CAEDRPVLMLIDDAQWLDATSADVIACAARRAGGIRVRAVVAERWPDDVVAPLADDPELILAVDEPHTEVSAEWPDGSAESRTAEESSGPGQRRRARAASLAPPPIVEMMVGPLAADDIADLLELYALPARAASRLHADSGGNPYL